MNEHDYEAALDDFNGSVSINEQKPPYPDVHVLDGYCDINKKTVETIRHALSIAKAAEQMAEALTSLMQYAKWQTTEGATYHPTLPSAIHAAENCLNTYNNAKNGG